MGAEHRLFTDSDGQLVRAWIAPREQAADDHPVVLDPTLNTLVFDTPVGEWIGSVPVYRAVTLNDFLEEGLRELVDFVRGRSAA